MHLLLIVRVPMMFVMMKPMKITRFLYYVSGAHMCDRLDQSVECSTVGPTPANVHSTLNYGNRSQTKGDRLSLSLFVWLISTHRPTYMTYFYLRSFTDSNRKYMSRNIHKSKPFND